MPNFDPDAIFPGSTKKSIPFPSDDFLLVKFAKSVVEKAIRVRRSKSPHIDGFHYCAYCNMDEQIQDELDILHVKSCPVVLAAKWLRRNHKLKYKRRDIEIST